MGQETFSNKKHIDAINSAANKYSYTEVDITSSQIKSMGSSPVELLPAPGANSYYDIDKIILEFTYAAPAYTSTDASFFIGTVDGNYVGAWFPKTLITRTANRYTVMNGLSPVNVVGSFCEYSEDELNLAIKLTTSSGSNNPASGNGTLKAKIYYRIVTIG